MEEYKQGCIDWIKFLQKKGSQFSVMRLIADLSILSAEDVQIDQEGVHITNKDLLQNQQQVLPQRRIA